MSKKTRPIAFGVFVGIFLLSYLIGTTYQMSAEEAQTFLHQFQGATAGIDATGIFLHNVSVALVMFVPAFGIAWGTYSGWQTGAAFHVIVSSNPYLAGIPPLAPLLFSPFGVMELTAYSIAMSRSYLIVWRLVKRAPWKSQLVSSAIEVGIVTGLLIIGGIVEAYLKSHSMH